MKRKVLSITYFEPEGFAHLEDRFHFVFPEKKHFLKEEVFGRINDAEVLITGSRFKIGKEIIDRGPNLKLIANTGVGYNHIHVDYAASKGIAVTNTPHAVLEPTAELTFALMLATARRIVFYDRKLRSPKGLSWGLYDHLGTMLYGKTLGILGMGRIGQAVARRAYASGMSIIYHNSRPLSEEIERKYDAQYVSFDDLLSKSDFLSLNAPATPDTYHIMGENEFNKMKPTAILVNAARGSLIDEKALVKALACKKIMGAGLDVYENEPYINQKLLMMENVVHTPHAGPRTIQAREDMQKEVAENIHAFFYGGRLSKVN